MRLDQFEKLEQLVKNTIDLVYELKFENNKLRKENEKLNYEVGTFSNQTPESLRNELKTLQEENQSLKELQKRTSNRLSVVLEKVKGISEGVEF